jgi:hypothetical protein
MVTSHSAASWLLDPQARDLPEGVAECALTRSTRIIGMKSLYSRVMWRPTRRRPYVKDDTRFVFGLPFRPYKPMTKGSYIKGIR